jgi:hypothetical protein
LSSEIEIHLTAIDDASAVIEEVGTNTATAMSQVQTAGEGVTEATDNTNVSVRDTALGFNNLATSGMSLYMAIDRVEHAQVALDRAHLSVERATNAVTSAQNAYNAAVAKYGPYSKEAQDALAKLHTAQEGLTVAQERANLAQGNYNNTIAFSAMTVIPSLITALTSITTIGPSVTGAVEAISGAMDFLAANPIVLVIAGIAVLVAWLVIAYNNCAPFRNAINEIGSVLSGAVLAAVNAIRDAFSWLWSNVLVPLGSFIVGTYVAQWNALRDALDWLWNNILKPIADFLEKTFITAINDVMKAAKPLEDVVNTIGGAAKAVGGAMESVGSAVGGGLSKAGGAISGFIGSICFSHALQKAAEESTVTMDNWAKMVSDQMDKGLTAIKDFNKEAMFAGAGAMADGGGLAGIGGPVTPVSIALHIAAPLVQIQGSADRETAQLAAKLVQDKLKNVLVEATGHGSVATHKRIRIGWQG